MMKQLLPRPRTALCRNTQVVTDILCRAPVTTTPLPQSVSATRPLTTTSSRQKPPPPATAFPTIVQAMPRGGYYDVLLTNPPPYSSARANQPPVTARVVVETKVPASAATESKDTETPKAAATATTTSTWKQGEAPATIAARKAAEQKTVQERAALVFGSRLAGPMERANRLAEIRKRSTLIAGVLVPPKPTEPDNCCMSGCVNCVWDRFRDEMEEWASANAEATLRLKAQEGGITAGMTDSGKVSSGPGTAAPSPATSMSMDDDGGGSDSNWSLEDAKKAASGTSKGGWDEDLYKSVPVGIREFMKQEKRLKLKHIHDSETAAAS
ncbi:hypothetical protein SBRCBS47491_003975 [Sporothrix bragantina]|uniref:Oxidoreductase-like domain-containing protein n=1 Tax=Sporothrix bragantina TaxID=671064 RepID=A0ABP0BJI0_9PEZI